MESFMSSARLFWAARAVTLSASSDCFFFFSFCCETRTRRQKKQSFWELSRPLLQTPPPRKHKHGTVQREPPTHPRYAWLCSSCIHLGCIQRSVQRVDAAFPPSTLSDSGSFRWRGAEVVRLLFLISEPLSLGKVGPGWRQLGYLLVLPGPVNVTGRRLPKGNTRRSPIHIPDTHLHVRRNFPLERGVREVILCQNNSLFGACYWKGSRPTPDNIKLPPGKHR